MGAASGPAAQAAVAIPLPAVTPLPPAAHAVPRPATVVAVEAMGAWPRVRAVLSLLLLLAFVGVVLAALVGVGLFVLNAVLRHAATGSGALGPPA